MEELRTFVKPPAVLKQAQEVKAFVDFVKKDFESLSSAQRKEKKLDLITYVASLAEFWFDTPKCGPLKKKAVLEACNGIDELHVLEEYLNLVLDTGKIVRKTMFKKAYICLKKLLKKALSVK